MPLQATSGAASYDAFGGGVPVEPVYIEQIFSTYLYKGNGDTQVITNDIDLSTKGGLVWAKSRSRAGDNHELRDTVRGGNSRINSNTTNPASSTPNPYTYNTDGYTIGGDGGNTNENNITYTSWSWAKAPKFFDVVTYSGSSSTQNIAHNLGSVPACIIVKRTSGAEDWFVYHTSLGNTQYLKLNTTGAAASGFAAWNNTSPTSTQFTVLGGRTEVNAAGSDYVAYLFAHNAGGFGLTGTDNVISCGTFTTDGSGQATVNLGYEPQWVLFKPSSTTGEWTLLDTMRGWVADGTNADKLLYANKTDAEIGAFSMGITATGFDTKANLGASQTHIYIAIRRGPMRVPTSGTSVYGTGTKQSTSPAYVTGFPTDMGFYRNTTTTASWYLQDRLRGQVYSVTNSTSAESADTNAKFDYQNGFYVSASANADVRGWGFRRAPGFFDEVCYTGGITSNPSHNLGVTPEMYIVKCRSSGTSDRGWYVYHTGYDTANNYILMNSSAGLASLSGVWSSGPTSTTFGVANGYAVNDSGQTYVAYLFATCAGVSKVTSFTGNGSSQTINCGFTAGSRFVMIKRTDSTGDWYVWDSARGIVSGNDPHLSLNSTAAEVTSDDTIDTDSTGFIVNQVSATNSNVNGASYIVLAIA